MLPTLGDTNVHHHEVPAAASCQTASGGLALKIQGRCCQQKIALNHCGGSHHVRKLHAQQHKGLRLEPQSSRHKRRRRCQAMLTSPSPPPPPAGRARGQGRTWGTGKSATSSQSPLPPLPPTPSPLAGGGPDSLRQSGTGSETLPAPQPRWATPSPSTAAGRGGRTGEGADISVRHSVSQWARIQK